MSTTYASNPQMSSYGEPQSLTKGQTSYSGDLPKEGLQTRPSTQFPSTDKNPQLQEQVIKNQWDRTGQGFQAQLQGAQPLQGQGIAGGSFNRETGVGLINLKPICIEQEPVMYRPQVLTIPQPPLMVQPEAISIPQPPIVIHPEPIVIPQPPLTFQPPAVSVPRPSITVQPEPVVLNRPSYSVQPTIQFDLHGCNKFNQPDFKQHVHVKLSGQQALGQMSQGSELQAQQSSGSGMSPVGRTASFSGQQNYRLNSTGQWQPSTGLTPTGGQATGQQFNYPGQQQTMNRELGGQLQFSSQPSSSPRQF